MVFCWSLDTESNVSWWQPDPVVQWELHCVHWQECVLLETRTSNLTELRVAWAGSTCSPGVSLGLMISEATPASTPLVFRQLYSSYSGHSPMWRILITWICCILKDGTPAFQSIASEKEQSQLLLWQVVPASGKPSCFRAVQYVMQQRVPWSWAQRCTSFL